MEEREREKRVRKLRNTVLLYLTTDNKVDRKSKRGINSPFYFCDKPRLKSLAPEAQTLYIWKEMVYMSYQNLAWQFPEFLQQSF